VFFLVTSSVSAQWIKQDVETKASLRGLSVVNEKVIWASGTGGTVIRTIDAGKTWKVMTVPGAEKLDFRDIEAFDAKTAYILSIGNGESSRIYKTVDGGKTWKLQFKNTNEKAFFDAIACWDSRNCIAVSDPVDGKFLLIQTKNGGTWSTMDSAKMPAAKDGEAAFAASGTCLITQGKNNAFLVTGGSAARVFRTNDRGKSWQVSDTPMIKGTPGSGIFSIAMRDAKNGVIVGGNYEKPQARDNTFARTNDGGATWQPGPRAHGYRSAVAYIDKDRIVAVGPNGTELSPCRSLLWQKLSDDNQNAVAARTENSIWAVGPNGDVRLLKPPRGEPWKCIPFPNGFGFPPGITAVTLSHDEIAADCAPSDSQCSTKRGIMVGAVGRDSRAA